MIVFVKCEFFCVHVGMPVDNPSDPDYIPSLYLEWNKKTPSWKVKQLLCVQSLKVRTLLSFVTSQNKLKALMYL